MEEPEKSAFENDEVKSDQKNPNPSSEMNVDEQNQEKDGLNINQDEILAAAVLEFDQKFKDILDIIRNAFVPALINHF